MSNLHLFQLSSWQSPSGKWYCNDVKGLNGYGGKWFTVMRLLDLSVEDYVNLLIKYNAKDLEYYPITDILMFHFDKEKDVKAFCSYVNKQAKIKNYQCI